jgi:hypothetical protein
LLHASPVMGRSSVEGMPGSRRDELAVRRGLGKEGVDARLECTARRGPGGDAEYATIGMSRVRASKRRALVAWKPSITGIMRSMRMRSGRHSRASVTPSRPSGGVRALGPARTRIGQRLPRCRRSARLLATRQRDRGASKRVVSDYLSGLRRFRRLAGVAMLSWVCGETALTMIQKRSSLSPRS